LKPSRFVDADHFLDNKDFLACSGPDPTPTPMLPRADADVFPASETFPELQTLLTDFLNPAPIDPKLDFRFNVTFSVSSFFKSGFEVEAVGFRSDSATFEVSSGFEVTRRWGPVPDGT